MSAAQTTLPSVVAAEKFLRGEEGGLMAVISSTAGRAGIIFMGLYLAGERKRTLRYSLAGALAIEAFVLMRIKAQLAADAQAALPATQKTSLPIPTNVIRAA